MSVFGSLFTAVSGLSAQSQSIGMISNNIANVSTIGFKRTDAAFASLVTSASRSTVYSPGSVRAIQNARIDQQGILQQSNSATDIAMSGNGFFIVKGSTTDPLSEPLYTRAGSFSEDSTGVLQNPGGFYLQGWPLDQDGNLPASRADVASLVPVDVAFLGGLTAATTTASLAVPRRQPRLRRKPGALPHCRRLRARLHPRHRCL
jgi:flagellar hook protein FlgE